MNISVCCHSTPNNICSVSKIVFEGCVHPLNDTPSIDLGLLVSKLPYDILLKIYTEYFRPHKFLNIYTQLIQHSWRISVEVRCREFQRHLPYFLYSQIRPIITKHSPEFAYIWGKICMYQLGTFDTYWTEKDKPLIKKYIYDEICSYNSYYIDENYFYY